MRMKIMEKEACARERKKRAKAPFLGRCFVEAVSIRVSASQRGGRGGLAGASVNSELGTEVVNDAVGGGGQSARVGEVQVRCDEEVGKVFRGDFASDLSVVAGGTCWFQDSAVVGRIDPNVLECSVA